MVLCRMPWCSLAALVLKLLCCFFRTFELQARTDITFPIVMALNACSRMAKLAYFLLTYSVEVE